MNVLVAGAAGFLGSHLCELLIREGHDVFGLDDFSSGRESNVASAKQSGHFRLERADISDSLPSFVETHHFDLIFNLASPASPQLYKELPLHTLKAGSLGTLNLLEFARRKNARFIMASTSEVYGDPEVHPQTEDYFGNVNTVGERSCYDEAKRFSEALCYTFHHSYSCNVGIARIFNTYGPRLSPGDGRVISSVIRSSVLNEPFFVFGDGHQTRSFCYVDDLIRGLYLLGCSEKFGPFNLGNPVELSIRSLIHEVETLAGRSIDVRFSPKMGDDPMRRRPDISRATHELGWTPTVPLSTGLTKTYDWIREILS
jgi:nucleoside-diphosphate-sugar epimerase